jgi:hypothetical protein
MFAYYFCNLFLVDASRKDQDIPEALILNRRLMWIFWAENWILQRKIQIFFVDVGEGIGLAVKAVRQE